jgi:hypothetical protein
MLILMKIRSYSELKILKTFEERYQYLKLDGNVGAETFGFDRYLNQILYKSRLWRDARNEVIIRDNGCDLGIDEYPLNFQIVVHHMNPINVFDIEKKSKYVYDPEYLICTDPKTHLAIHFSDEKLLNKKPIIRVPNDTVPWK